MKLTLRPEWRLWPVNNFLGLLDLKTGVTITLSLQYVFNKVAGIYGLISVLAGEPQTHTILCASLFLDHILSTIWTLFFAVVWWVYTPPRRTAPRQLPRQEFIKESANVSHPMTDAQLAAAANILWHEEKGTAVAVIVLSWIAKAHTTPSANFRLHPSSPAAYLPAYTEDDDNEDFHIPSLRTHHPNSTSSNIPDFVSAPGRSGRHSARQSRSSLGKIMIPLQENGDVLFEENSR
ncbi:hypothetical protein EDC04DRAFT_2883626 [Pisolithus marmoratus]|nr:hypothetical protein EDC04DRAFT_2883626 [Pisolithus marmoratus]